MIPFVFAGLYSVIKNNNPLGWAALVSSIFTIGLTFSRGAYVALALSLLGVGVALIIKNFATFKKVLLIYSVIAATIIISLSTLILTASIRYSDSPNIAYETLDSILEHLTIGVIDLPESRVIIIQNQAAPQESTDDTFVSPGLIEASNQERTSAAQLAIKAWSSTIITAIAGVGLGNLGPYVVNNIDISAPENLTVYIFYILFLAELGVIGLVALVLLFAISMLSLLKNLGLVNLMIVGILTSFTLQFLFFGSYINVVYIWLWIGIALGLTGVISAEHPKKRYTKHQ